MGARPNCMYCGSSFGKSVTISGQDAIRAESTLIARMFWCVSGFNSKLELQATMHESPDAPTINLIYARRLKNNFSSIGTTRRPWTLATLWRHAHVTPCRRHRPCPSPHLPFLGWFPLHTLAVVRQSRPCKTHGHMRNRFSNRMLQNSVDFC